MGYQKNQKIALLSPTTGLLEVQLDSPMASVFRLIQFTKENKHLCAVNSKGKVTMWPVPYPTVYAIFDHEKEVKAISFSTDGTILRARDVQNQLIHWNLNTGQPLSTSPSVSFQPEGVKVSTKALRAEIQPSGNQIRVFRNSNHE